MAFAALLAGCIDPGSEASITELNGSAMGTTYSVKIVAAPQSLDIGSLQREIDETVASIERQMSTYIADSEISQFNAHRGVEWFPVSQELCELVYLALNYGAASDGAFDITVGPLVNLWGFGPDGTAKIPPEAGEIAIIMHSIGDTALHADCSMPALLKDNPTLYVDLSAIAKGYGVDRVAELLDRRRIGDYLVEIGGEMRMRGSNAKGEDWAIAIESPDPTVRAVHSIVGLTDVGVATSGDYRNFFEHEGTLYSHTIDPRTGYPITHSVASVTVVADTAAYADAMATALLVLGPKEGLEFAEREGIAAYFLLRDDGGLEEQATSLFVAEVSTR